MADPMFDKMSSFLTGKISQLKNQFPGYNFEQGKLGSWMAKGTKLGPFWGSIFVTNPQGINIGRLLYIIKADGLPRFSHTKPYGENLKGVQLDSFWERVA